MSISVYRERIFMLNTERMSYVIYVDKSGLLGNAYWGSRLERVEDFEDAAAKPGYHNCSESHHVMEECSSYGSFHFKEPSVKLQYKDGTGDFRYRVDGYEIDGNVLSIRLRDVGYPFEVVLHYRVYEKENIVEKWREARNLGEEPVMLRSFYSGEFGVPGTGYQSINFTGFWGGEFQYAQDSLTAGKKVYESRFGLTAHEANPCFIVHRDADEEHGDVYYGALAYSGNFKISLEAVSCDYVNILAGIQDMDFEWELGKGERFVTPSVYAGYSSHGFGEMSRTMSGFAKRYLMPEERAGKVLPVLYNSWCVTEFDVSMEEQLKLAEKAAALGVELFVMDDGWFQGRTCDKYGLGDWYPDTEKFPRGLGELIGHVNDMGMKFGIWVEPEMVSPHSQLYRNHPDWALHYENREILMWRNQYVLDMTNPEVVAYLVEQLDGLLTENHIEYIKWDMNRYLAETGNWKNKETPKRDFWYQYAQGFYSLAGELRQRHPDVEFEACASGGGRVDYGVMRYFDEYWTSDNTDALDRLYIQESYSLMYPVRYMRAWVTDDLGMNHRTKVPLKFNCYAAMCGVLGIGMNINAMPQEQLEEVKFYVEEYKKVRGIIQNGELYRIASMREGQLQAVQYVTSGESRDELQSVVFVFSDRGHYGRRFFQIKLQGLNPDVIYRIESEGICLERSGAYCMKVGLETELIGDYGCQMFCLKAI